MYAGILNGEQEMGSLRLPEHRLFRAMIRSCIDDLMLPPEKLRIAERKSAQNWLLENDKRYLFSFTNCCLMLGCNPEKLRRKILKCLVKSRKCWRRSHKRRR
jgi:hypothetical protein